MKRADAPVPGWYPDPVQRARLRWWDGSDWSDHHRVGPRPTDLMGDPPEGGGSHPAGRSWSTGAGSGPGSGSASPGYAGSGSRIGSALGAADAAGEAAQRAGGGMTRQDASALVAEVRRTTRGELDRATRRLADQAGDLRTQLEPLVREYSRRVVRWARRAALVAVVFYMLYVIVTTQLQAGVLDWVGERIDLWLDRDGS